MKRFGFITFAVLTAVFFSSCNDSDGDYASSWAFASAETLNSNDYYFVLDDNKTVYPSDKSRVAGYKPEDDQSKGTITTSRFTTRGTSTRERPES